MVVKVISSHKFNQMKKFNLLFMMLAVGLASLAQTASVTFNVDMSAEDVAESGVYVAGGDFFGEPGTYPMTDEDGDGIYTIAIELPTPCLLYTSPSPRDGLLSRMPSSA